MTDKLQPKDRAILEAVDRLNGEGAGDAAPEPLVREYTELLALLPYELEPVTPRPDVKLAILAQVGGPQRGVDDLTLVQGARRGGGAAERAAHEKEKAAAEITLVKFPGRREKPAGVPAAGVPAAGVPAAGVPAAGVPAAGVPVPVGGGWRFGRTLLPLAATLAVCLVGLGYLVGRVQDQQQRIVRLESELTSAQTLAEELGHQFQMVATTARTAYPLRATASQTACSGTVFVCGQHQQWLLSVRDMSPAPAGREYHLWFVTEEGMIDAGSVEIRGSRGSLEAPTMPEGTRGFALSLEEPGELGKPEGQIMLLGDKPVTL